MKYFKYEIVDKNKTYYGQENVNFAGVFGTKRHMGSVLLELNSFDIDHVIKGVTLKENEIILRYTNVKTKISKITPLVKININKGLIYFLSDNNNNDNTSAYCIGNCCSTICSVVRACW